MKSLQYILGVGAVSAVLLLSGCGSSDSEAENSMLAQQYLDNQEYAQAAALLESKENKTDSDYMMLSSAYMGESGFSFSEVLKIIAKTGIDANATTSSAPAYKAPSNDSDDSYVKFLNEVEKVLKDNEEALAFLQKAQDAINKVQAQSDSVGLNKGLVLTMKASSAFTYMGDVTALVKDATVNEAVKNDFSAYGCAIAEVYAGKHASKCSNVIVETSTISIKEKPYKKITVTIDGINYYKVANAQGDSVMLTTGLCNDNDTSGCIKADDNVTLVPKPVGSGSIDIKAALIDTINDGFDTLVKLAPDDTKEDVRKYRDEIDTNSDNTISAEEISAYIDTKIE